MSVVMSCSRRWRSVDVDVVNGVPADLMVSLKNSWSLSIGWNRVGAPLIPDDAFILLPPGFGALSSMMTGTWWKRSWDAADNPASPEPTTIAGVDCSNAEGVESADIVTLFHKMKFGVCLFLGGVEL